MHLQEEEKNVLTGILGTVAVHLLLIIVFLIARIDKVKSIHQEQIVIEFDEEVYKTLEEMIEENKAEQSQVEQLSDLDMKNIAVNTANELEQDISTEDYIEDLKEELDIEDLYQDLNTDLENIAVEPETQQKNEKKERKNYQGPTRIEYDLDGRGHRYIHYPIYKCQGAGRVVVDIVVNPEGNVISATVANTNTKEICISETALESARRSRFEIDLSAEAKQQGTITYEFVAQ